MQDGSLNHRSQRPRDAVLFPYHATGAGPRVRSVNTRESTYMNTIRQSLDRLEQLAGEQPPDSAHISALVGTLREEFSKLNVSQQRLIETNVALIQRVQELEKAAKDGRC